jgi:hypothetical protein
MNEDDYVYTRQIVAVDLGKLTDFSALVVAQRTANRRDAVLDVPMVKRWPIGTPYLQIAADVKAFTNRPLFRDAILVVDGTGVGSAVVELLAAAVRLPFVRQLLPVVITGGHNVTGDPTKVRVPKSELASAVQQALGTRRLRIARSEDSDVLRSELQHFERFVNPDTGHESFEAGRGHDDTVLALALACWFARREQPRYVGPLVLSGAGAEDRVKYAGERTGLGERLTTIFAELGIDLEEPELDMRRANLGTAPPRGPSVRVVSR